MKNSTRCSITWSPCGARGAKTLFLAGFLSLAARAEEPAVYVIGSRLPVSEVGVAQPVKIIRPEGASSVPDALRSVPDVHVDQPGAPAGFTSLYLRGADPNHAVYLFDGVKVNDPTNPRGGGFDFGSLEPHAVERVEILPGASSAIYGADAMAGVVSFRTPPPRGSGLRLGGGLGGLGYRRLSASMAGKSLRIGAAVLEDGGESDLGFKRIRSIALRMPQISLRAWQHETRAFPEDSGGPRLAVLRELERRDGTSVLGSADTQAMIGAGVLRARVGVLAQEQDASSPGVAPGVRDPFGLPRTLSSSRFNRWNAAVTAEFGSAVVGAEYQAEDGDSASSLFFGPTPLPADFALERATRSVFGEASWDVLTRLTAKGGVRFDNVDGYATRANVQAGLRHDLTAGPSIGVRLGTGFKPPSFFSLAHPLVGNPYLRPEQSRTAEVNVSSSEDAPTRHRLSLFHARYEDLIDFDPGPPPRLVNRSEVTIRGAEYAFASRLSSRISVAAGLSSFSFELPSGAGPLRSRPQEKASATVDARLSDSLNAKLGAVWVGRVFDSSIPTGGVYLPSYMVVDAVLSHELAATAITLAIDNLFDRDYEQFIGFPAPGRRLRVEVRHNL